MEDQERLNNIFFGLIGKNISYSFSKTYFSKKFKNLQLSNSEYLNFDLKKIEDFSAIIHKFKGSLRGLNVTIPYKLSIFNYVDHVDETAKKVGAINTIKFANNGSLIGYNTDVFGFENSLTPILKKHHNKALILGTGGASKAVSYVFEKLNIEYFKVSRNPKDSLQISYEDITNDLLNKYTIIVNCSPVGTFPNINDKPTIPYHFLTDKHLLYDLIYNPTETAFLKEGKKQFTQIKNGYEMLELQAEESWRIWNN